MSEHHGSITVQAPAHQAYNLFTHFNDFPKFMSFVKEVTYLDDQRSHWVAQVGGAQEWDAINENWLPDRQIGWRSTHGLENRGVIKFTPIADTQTLVDAYITYNPPAGILGEVADRLGFDNHFDAMLQYDLDNFARMVEDAPAEALDPMQSNYLFHQDSAVARNNITPQQQASMQRDPMMGEPALQERSNTLQQRQDYEQQIAQQQEADRQQRQAQQQQVAHEQSDALHRQAELNRQEWEAQQAQQAQNYQKKPLDPVQDTIGGRNASMERLAIGDQDARTERFPGHHEDPMLARRRLNQNERTGASDEVENMEIESPWRTNIIGTTTEPETPEERNPESA